MAELEYPLATITLGDGSRLSNLQLNGDNFISSEEITEATFFANLDNVIIDTENGRERHPHMALTQIVEVNNSWWFVLRDLTDREISDAKLRSDLDYIAMMTDVDLEEL
jgi:hypothetical protein